MTDSDQQRTYQAVDRRQPVGKSGPLKLIDRGLPLVVMAFWLWLGVESWEWFTSKEDISVAQSGFLSLVMTSLAASLKFYVDRNNDSTK